MVNPKETVVPYVGRKATIRYAVTRRGTMPARQFLEQLQPAVRAKFYSRIVVLADQGDLPNEQMFKRLDAQLWEIKIGSPALRLMCFRHGGDWVLTHGCKKLSKKEFQVEMDRAGRIRREHLEQAADADG